MKRIIACFIFAIVYILPAHAAKMVIQRQGNDQLREMVLSPHGEYLAYSMLDDGIELWQAQRGEFLTHFPKAPGHQKEQVRENPIMFSSDGKILFTLLTERLHRESFYAHLYYSVLARKVPSGKIIQTFANISPPFWSDGTVLRVTDGNTIRTWRVSDGALLYGHILESPALPKDEYLRHGFQGLLTFSRNGNFLAYAGHHGDASIRVWDTQTGNLLHKINKYSAGGTLAISNDGRYLLAQGVSPDWTVPKLKLNEYYSLDLQLWDLKTDSVIRTWNGSYTDDNDLSLQFYDNGKQFFSTDGDSSEIYDVATGKSRSADASTNQAISPDGLFQVNDHDEIRLRSTVTGKVIQTLPSKMEGGPIASLSPDDNFLATGGNAKLNTGYPLHIWNLITAILMKPKPEKYDYPVRLRWGKKHILGTDEDYSTSKFKIRKDENTFTQTDKFYETGDDTFDSLGTNGDGLFTSPNHKYIIGSFWVTDYTGAIIYYVWDGVTHKQIRTFKGADHPGADAFIINWMPDSQRFVMAASGGLGVWNIQTFQPEQFFDVPSNFSSARDKSDHRAAIKFLATSPDEKYMAGTNRFGKPLGIGIWSITTGKLIMMIPTTPFINSALTNDISFTTNNQLQLIGDTGSGPHMKVLNWQKDKNGSAKLTEAPIPENKLFALGDKSSIKIYRASSGKLVAQCAVTVKNADEPHLQNSDWLIWTPQGYFNAPDHGRKRVRWEENGKMIPLDSPRDKALRAKFYNPQKVSAIIAGGR